MINYHQWEERALPFLRRGLRGQYSIPILLLNGTADATTRV